MLLLKAEFVYNNMKNASTGHISFELNCKFHPKISYEKDVNPRSKFKEVDKLVNKLWTWMSMWKKIANMNKSFGSTTMIGMRSLETMPQVRNFVEQQIHQNEIKP